MTAVNRKSRIAVGVSGSGRSLENLIRYAKENDAAFVISGVIASRSDLRSCEIAKANQLPLIILPFTKSTMASSESSLYEWLELNQIDLVALAGFLKPYPIRPDWENRVVNIHPALLPKYGGHGMYGHFVHEAVVAAGEKQSGASVHYVNGRYDEGQIIAQASVSLRADFTAEDVAAKVFAAECDLYPKVLDRLANGTLPTKGTEPFRYHYEPK